MIKDQKDLQALLKLCRKQGVTEITLEGVSIKFGELPLSRKQGDVEDTDDDSGLIDGLTPEQMAFYSVTPMGGSS